MGGARKEQVSYVEVSFSLFDFISKLILESADLVFIWVPFNSHSLFFIKLRPREKIELLQDRENCAEEMSYLHQHRKAQRNWEEV